MDNFIYKYTVSTLIKNEAFIGKSRNTRDITSAPFIFESNNYIDTIDLSFTYTQLCKILKITTDIVSSRSNLLVYNSQTTKKNTIINNYFLTKPWKHGMVSNYKILKEHKKLSDLKLPSFVINITDDSNEHQLISNELNKINIPLVSITNTSTKTTQSLYTIPYNSKSPKANLLLTNLLTQAIARGIIKETLKLKNTKLNLPRLDLNQRPVD